MKWMFLLFTALVAFNGMLHAQRWKELGSESNCLNANNYIVSICADSSGVLYAAGGFTDSLSNTAGSCYVAKWDGMKWSMLGSDTGMMNSAGETSSICVDAHHNLFIVASIKNIGDKVMKWNGAEWSEPGGGTGTLNANGAINSLCVDPSGNVYAAGSFTDLAGQYYVAEWNGTEWRELGAGINALNPNLPIRSIACDLSGNIYAAGEFYLPGTISSPGAHYFVAKWNGSSWSVLGTGSNALNANAQISALSTDIHGHVYAGGWFTDAAGKYYVAKWDGVTWSELGTGSNSLNTKESINFICTDAFANVYVNQFFSTYGDSVNVSEWNGSYWRQLGTGTNALNANSEIWTVCTDVVGNVYAAGDFTDGVLSEQGHQYVAFYDHKYDGVSLIGSTSGKINVYPNPAKSAVYIDINGDFSCSDYVLVSMSGIVVCSGTLVEKNSSINIGDIPPGAYLLKLAAYPNCAIKLLKK